MPTLDLHESDYVAHDFHFQSGETLPELKFHRTTLGTPVRNAKAAQAAGLAHGRFVTIPASDQTHGHGTHTWAAVWPPHLAELLKESGRRKAHAPSGGCFLSVGVGEYAWLRCVICNTLP